MAEQMPPHAVAIIGMAGRFPGARNLDEFWHNISTGVEILETVSEAEMDAAGSLEGPAIESEFRTKMYGTRGCGLSSMLASSECRRARLRLSTLNTAFFLNARGRPSRTPGIRRSGSEQSIGVYAGASMNTYVDQPADA